jgi:uncharacterized protein YggE
MSDIVKQVCIFSLKSFALLVLIVIFAAIAMFAIVEPAISKITTNHEFTVDGIAKKNITPDIAYVNISAIFTGDNAGDLKKQADKALTDTVNGLKSLSSSQIKDEEIKTNYSLSPKYDKDGQNIIGYTTTPTLEVKTKDFTAIDKVIEIASQNKLNLVNSVYFTIEDQVKAKEQLRDEAIAAAKAKAEKIARETGLRLGKMTNFSENNYQPYYSYNKMESLANSVTGSDSVTAPDSTSTTFNPGETEIQMTVYLTYTTY